jgi:hypothetical protein
MLFPEQPEKAMTSTIMTGAGVDRVRLGRIRPSFRHGVLNPYARKSGTSFEAAAFLRSNPAAGAARWIPVTVRAGLRRVR